MGSGFLIDGRRVLTSGHVAVKGALLVRRAGEIGAPKTEWNATLKLFGDLETADLALIELDEEVEALPPMGFARVSRRTSHLTTVEKCHAVGFPLFMKNSDDPSAVRETAHVSGHIPNAQYLVAGLLTLQVTHRPRALPRGREPLKESQWSGMSGAAVLVEDRILGVISEHAERQGDSSLTVVPLSLIEKLSNASSWWAELGVEPDDFLVLPQSQSILTQRIRSIERRWRSSSVRKRALVLTASIGAVTLAATLAMPPDRPHSRTPHGSPSGNPSKKTQGIENLGFTVASSGKSYRAILSLQNSQSKDQMLDEVELIVTLQGPACAEVPYILVYSIQAPITVDPSGKIKRGSVSADSGLAQGFTAPASGQLNWGCGMDQLQLQFRPSGAILARKATTSILIDIPRKLRVTKMINGVDGFEASSAELPSMSDPYTDYIAFHAVSTISSGERISSCFLLAASDHKPGTGPQRCDAKIGETPVFWRQKYGPNRSWLKYERVS
ncbi:trypsin-like peptidase domain-containing protein [Streptomyces sp. FZ201]|uniref:trypsin-like peptidase domain-containing protein n=1 Tax=Streptomyces sp. FZ201 TaxID=3057122 RepID=UPI0021BF229C|nr:trypsin-like peptidase domain-containing protein [Streptomyces sp. FZ201]